MKKNILFFLIFIAVIFSCKKKENTNPEIVYAGVQNGDMYTKVYSPGKEILMTFDAQNLYATGKDSIDVDNDGVHDFIFYLDYYNLDSVHLISGNYPNPVPSFKMEFKDDILVTEDSVGVYVGLGSVTFFKYATAFHFDEQISFYKKWKKNSIKIWEDVPIWTSLAKGEWFTANGKRFIGFHKNQKIGWIEIDISNPRKPIILAHSIQK